MSNYSDSHFANDPNTPWYKVLSMIEAKSKVLDVGCSSGNFGKVLINKKQCIVDGIELDKNDAQKASNILRKVYTNNLEIEGNGFLEGKKYDVIYFGDVIEHLVNPVQTLNVLKRNLAKNGSIIYSIPNMAHMSVRLMLMRGEFEYGETGLLDKTHLHFYDKSEVERVIRDAGYQSIVFDYIKRDIPRDVLKAELDKIGLTASRTFLDNSKRVEASAYQFVGKIQPTDSAPKSKPLPKRSPAINEMEKHIAYVKTVHSAQINAHKERIHQLEVENQALQNQLSHHHAASLRTKISHHFKNKSKTSTK